MKAFKNIDDWYLLSCILFSVALSYPIGYIVIEIFAWVELTPEQLQNGFPHVARYLMGLLGLMLLALPMLPIATFLMRRG